VNTPVKSSLLSQTTLNDRQRAVGFAVGAENDGLPEGMLDGLFVGCTEGVTDGRVVDGKMVGI